MKFKILSIDGGGIKGIVFPQLFPEHLEASLEVVVLITLI